MKTIQAGLVFGRWVVLGEGKPKKFPSGQQKRTAVCRCSCSLGVTREVPFPDLTTGKSQSCGCLCSEQTRKRNRRHGMAHTGLTESYRHMMNRCYAKTIREWRWYGGRKGKPIGVCQRWRESVSNFVLDMGSTWVKGLTLDRIDVNSDYNPENCRWVTREDQQRNKRNNRQVVLEGKPMILVEAAEALGMCRHSLRGRLNRGGGVAVVAGKVIMDARFYR